MAKRGRKRIYDPEVLAEQLYEYIESTEDPYIEEFCLNHEQRVSKDTVYRLEKECSNLSDAIKRCHLKQQLRTMRGVENGTIHASWGIFKVKQAAYGGFKDKQEIEHSGEQKLVIDIDIEEE